MTAASRPAPRARKTAAAPAGEADPKRASRAPRVPKASPSAPAPEATREAEVTDEDIRVRAYFLSLEYGGHGRSDMDFWLLAERELRAERNSHS